MTSLPISYELYAKSLGFKDGAALKLIEPELWPGTCNNPGFMAWLMKAKWLALKDICNCGECCFPGDLVRNHEDYSKLLDEWLLKNYLAVPVDKTDAIIG